MFEGSWGCGSSIQERNKAGVRDVGAIPVETVFESLGSGEKREQGPGPALRHPSPGGLSEARIGENRQLEREEENQGHAAEWPRKYGRGMEC